MDRRPRLVVLNPNPPCSTQLLATVGATVSQSVGKAGVPEEVVADRTAGKLNGREERWPVRGALRR
ncbi:MAG: hypothetical protein P0120_22160 [Nitrospira sp.]|nr:hypothetical protein [Nitrospira sp.]